MKKVESKPLVVSGSVGDEFIPQIQPYMDDLELQHITEVVQSTFITENKKTEEFLERIKEITGSQYAIAMGNGTLALIAALLAEGIGRGDEVIVPDLTFIATANAVKLAGATPVFCDVDRQSGCITPENFLPLITPATRCIMPVHLYGQVSPMAEIMQVADQAGLVVIEDAAESFAIWDRGKHSGTFGQYGTFSFFANKTITCGEGGVVLTDSEERYKRLYRVKNHGRDRKGIFVHEAIGFNFCFTDLQAAIGVAQLEKLDYLLAQKRRNYEFYRQAFAGHELIQLMETPDHIESNHWFVNVLIPDPERMEKSLLARNIQTRRFFYPLHLQPCFSEDHENAARDYPNTEMLFSRGVSLPSSASLTLPQLEYIAASVIDCLEN